MSFIDAATKGLTDVVTEVKTTLADFAADLGLDFESIPEIELPIPNVLHDYATYDYILSISVLHDNDINFPDKSYFRGVTLQPGDRNGKPLQLICKSANADPNNRVHSDYGKFDFFIDELSIKGMIGFINGDNITSTNMEFTVKEPYSMGLFTMACQQAAWDAEHPNWNVAPFLLTIEFRGNDEIGTMTPIPNSTRYIPFVFTNIEMAVNETGSTYQVKALVWNSLGISSEHANLKTDMTIKGTTVQEVLQTGDKSLQSVWNARLQQFKKDGIIEVPDEILIIFPTSIASAKKGESEDGGSATDGTASEIYKKLGVTEVTVKGKDNSPDVKYHVQKANECNNIGKSELGFGPDRAGDVPYGNEDMVYDDTLKVYVRGKAEPNPKESDFKFKQDSSIPNAIDQVILQSKYPSDSLEEANMSPSGFKKWWKIDIEVYNVSTDANNTSTGVKPKIIVYRVIPYNVHNSSGLMVINQKGQGFDKLLLGAIKEYNYLYTGKNVDVLSFDLGIKNTFTQIMAADYSKSSQDVKTADKTGAESSTSPINDIISFFGKSPEKSSNPQRVSYTATTSGSDNVGGGGTDTPKTRAAKLFHDALLHGNDMVNLELRIVGDPGLLHHSGLGNYTSKPTQYPNLNKDGTINYQSGEVYFVVNFRTPIDIDQTTGMYQFNGEVASTPLLQYSGLFNVTNIVSTFRGGQFEQVLSCRRASLQESPQEDSKNHPFSLGNIVNDVKDFFS